MLVNIYCQKLERFAYTKSWDATHQSYGWASSGARSIRIRNCSPSPAVMVKCSS